jgi:hypothetical protein
VTKPVDAMADEKHSPESFSLSRWSRRKLEAARPAPAVAAEVPLATAAPAAEDPAPLAQPEPPPLPPVESLSLESDFSVFMQPKVEEDVKRAALKKLFSDPRFNLMDGLDIYTGDYTQADPMPVGMLEKLGNVYAMLKDEPVADAETAAAAATDAGVATPVAAIASEPPVVDAALPVIGIAPAVSVVESPPTDVPDAVPRDEKPT